MTTDRIAGQRRERNGYPAQPETLLRANGTAPHPHWRQPDAVRKIRRINATGERAGGSYSYQPSLQ